MNNYLVLSYKTASKPLSKSPHSHRRFDSCCVVEFETFAKPLSDIVSKYSDCCLNVGLSEEAFPGKSGVFRGN